MSPHRETTAVVRIRFPRVSGDEPFAGDLKTGRRVFSPRERG